jgi:hypothetical protein
MKFKAFPEGYDPLVASHFPPNESYIQMGITWTKEQHLKAKELENQCFIVDSKSEFLWYQEISEDEIPRTGQLDLFS